MNSTSFVIDLVSPSGSIFTLVVSVQNIAYVMVGFSGPLMSSISVEHNLTLGLPYFIFGGLGLLMVPFVM